MVTRVPAGDGEGVERKATDAEAGLGLEEYGGGMRHSRACAWWVRAPGSVAGVEYMFGGAAGWLTRAASKLRCVGGAN